MLISIYGNEYIIKTGVNQCWTRVLFYHLLLILATALHPVTGLACRVIHAFLSVVKTQTTFMSFD